MLLPVALEGKSTISGSQMMTPISSEPLQVEIFRSIRTWNRIESVSDHDQKMTHPLSTCLYSCRDELQNFVLQNPSNRWKSYLKGLALVKRISTKYNSMVELLFCISSVMKKKWKMK